jgi:hypothetical protein
MRRLSFALSAFLLASPAPAAATTYFVRSGGNDARAGTSVGTAWRTVDRVNRAGLHPGDSVLFAGAQVFGDATLQPSTSGNPGAPITFGSYGRAPATIANAGGAVSLIARHDLRFARLRLSSNGSTATVVSGEWRNASQRIDIDRCRIENTRGIGVFSAARDDADWTIRRSALQHIGDSGVIVIGHDVTVEHSSIVDTGWNTDIAWGKHGIYAKGPAVRVIGNRITRFSGSGVTVRFRNALVRGNDIRGGDAGISYFRNDPGDGGTSRFDGNKIADVRSAGIFVSGSDEAGSTNESFTVTGNRIRTSTGAVALDMRATTGHIELRGNVLGGTGTPVFWAFASDPSRYQEDGNRFCRAPNVMWNGKWMSFASYRAASGKGGGDKITPSACA